MADYTLTPGLKIKASNNGKVRPAEITEIDERNSAIHVYHPDGKSPRYTVISPAMVYSVKLTTNSDWRVIQPSDTIHLHPRNKKNER